MKFTIDIDDDGLDALATLIAGKLGTTTVVEDDDFGTGGPDTKPKELTLTDVQDAVGKAVGVHGKDKVKASVKKVAGVAKVADIPADKFQAVLDALSKLK